MSAIQSLLRVMALRDAEAMVLETAKVPSLRRRGLVEPLAMPALEAQQLDDFVAPLVADKPIGEWPSSVPFRDDDGTMYQLTLERVPGGGLRIIVRKGAASKAAPPPKPVAPGESRAWWAAKPAAAAADRSPPAEAADRAPLAEAVGRSPLAEAVDRSPSPSPSPSAVTAAVAARLVSVIGSALVAARDHGASDVIFSTRQTPRMRIDGRLEPLEQQIDEAELSAIAAAAGGDADLSIEVDGTRARVNIFTHLGGAGIAARLIRDRVPSLSELGLPAELGNVIEARDGLVLVCGPTGSGKSTTLASLVDLIDQRRAAHVITLEDPIEYRFAARRGLIHQREIGTHAPSFAAGLRAALREAPDVILLGELRDRDTIAAALTAAETGHLVLATLHASSAAGAIDRIIDAFPEGAQRQIRWQLAAVLRTVVTQFLLPRASGGRVPAIELVPATGAVCNIIRKGDLHTLPTAIQSGREAGMIPLERSLAQLLESRAVAPGAVKKIAADHDLLASLSAKLR